MADPTQDLNWRHGKPCVVAGCDRRSRHATGMCELHRKRAARGGDLSKPVRIVTYGDVLCLAEDCNEAAKSRGMCKTHWTRWRRNGHLETHVAPAGSAAAHGNGYLVLTRVGHPLAAKSGRVYEHRAVLFASIGPGWHSCHWCGRPVSWDSRDLSDPTTLVVDHLNCIRDDNRPENLVPSCPTDNGKGRAPIDTDSYRKVIPS